MCLCENAKWIVFFDYSFFHIVYFNIHILNVDFEKNLKNVRLLKKSSEKKEFISTEKCENLVNLYKKLIKQWNFIEKYNFYNNINTQKYNTKQVIPKRILQ